MKPSIPQGTRDFSPAEVRRRQYIFDTLRRIFELYGFQPLETPAMENLSTLMGKYGEEGDRLIFKILNNGLHEKKDKEALNTEWQKLIDKPYSTSSITERALRYDLTIPFARYVATNHQELAMPFRRYQMQPVWRADRPQRGRYREFWQCDCDVVGSTSLLNEAELLCIYREAFYQLKIPVTIKLNNRKILTGIAQYCGAEDKITEIATALDKVDKIGIAKVQEELVRNGLSSTQAQVILKLVEFRGKVSEWNSMPTSPINEFRRVFIQHNIEVGLAGLKELEEIISYHQKLEKKEWIQDLDNSSFVEINFNLARGLNYYTGFIAEVVCSRESVKMGSIGGGGRYDDLTGLFGVKGIPGVGISFGIDRIYDVLEELQLFPESIASVSKVMLVNFGGENEIYAISVLNQLRAAGINAELYPEAAKFDKQLKYANKRSFQFVLLPGDAEREAGKISLKDFSSGQQETVAVSEAIERLR